MIRRAALAGLAALTLTGCGSVTVPQFAAHTTPVSPPKEQGMVHAGDPATDPAAVLAGLAIRPPVDVPGYSREQFPHWTDRDGNGCDGREEAIGRAAGARGCPASTVSVPDAYSGRPVAVRSADADHSWPLHEAWNAGASRWSKAEREAYANDPLVVVMTSSSTNRAKSDRMPPRFVAPDPAAECRYVARLVAVGAKYRLAVTTTERNAMRVALASCPDQRLPTT